MTNIIEALRQHQLVILRRLRAGPLTEFELTREVAENSGYSYDQAAESMADWLEELRLEGYIWSGALTNSSNQQLHAAALTKQGRELVE